MLLTDSFLSTELKITGLSGSDKLAVLQECPGIPGPPGPKGDQGMIGMYLEGEQICVFRNEMEICFEYI